MKYFFIIGERSGDLHASNLIKAIKQTDSDAEIAGVGGELSEQAGMQLSHHYKDLAIMGFVKVLTNLRRIKKNFTLCQSALLEMQPDVVVLVDFPGFNLKMAEFAKANKFKVCYYIAPKVWASREKRVERIKRYTDKVYTIFPFENDYFKSKGVNFEYVGNPLLDAISNEVALKESKSDFISRHQLSDKPIIALLAGSRKQEVQKLLPKYLEVKAHFPDYQFVLAGVDNIGNKFYASASNGDSLPQIIYNDTYALLKHSEAALVASGTATLEAALIKTPQAVCYDLGGGKLAYNFYTRFLVKVKYVSLVNLIMDKVVVKELIQHFFTVSNMIEELQQLLSNTKYRKQMLLEYDEITDRLGGQGASLKTAESIYKLIQKK